MAPLTVSDYEISFNEPLLRMSVAGRFLVRVITWIFYIIALAATFTALISPNPGVRAFGIFFTLFFIDRFAHWREGDLPIAELPPKGNINVAELMRPAVTGALARVFDQGLVGKREFFLLLADRLTGHGRIEEGLRRLDVEPKEFKAKIKEFLMNPVAPESASRAAYLHDAETLSIAALREALAAGHNFIELADLFSALPAAGSESIRRIFRMFNIEAGDLQRALIFSSERHLIGRIPRSLGEFSFAVNRRRRHRIMNRAWTSRPTPTLDRYGTDFTDLAREGGAGFLIGHETEYTRLVETISRSLNPNALLIGDAGIGKETILLHLAQELVNDKVPEALFDKRLVSLDIQALAAGAAQDELSARLRKIVDEIYKAGNIILYIPDIHHLVNTSGTAYLSAADILMPIIFNNEFPVVGGTYPKEFKLLIEPRSDFTDAFEVIRVEEISEADAEKVLAYEGLILEAQHRVTISFGAVKRAVALAKRYFHEKFLPASAEELLKSALVDAEKRGEKTLTADRVTAVAESKTNVPLHEAGGEEAQKLLHLEEIIHERLVDQEEAVAAIATSLREYRSGIARKGGPIASFLFVGPTGVGKTELAKILAEVQFGSEEMMVRFDMTEYQDKQSFIRFIGSPDGAVRGALTEAIRQKPYSLILLDEFEKAYPDILDLFLQVFDDGRLTDGLGRTVDFTNAIIVATSNAHSDIINGALAKGESMAGIAEYLKRRLVDVFKPELINRFSKIIIFKEIGPGDLAKIVAMNLGELAESVKDKGIMLEFDEAAVELLTKQGYDPAFGARPLRRVIDDKVRALLARAILEHRLSRESHLKLVVAGTNRDEFAFEVLEQV